MGSRAKRARMNLAAWTLAASSLVTDPAGHHMRPISQDGAAAIAAACTATPLFQDDDGRHCVALLVVMAARESGYQLGAVGDGGRARGPWQVHTSNAPTTWREAVDQYIPIVKRSMKACPEHPLAVIASGTCTNKAGRAISASRIAEAKRVYALAAWKGNDT